MAPSTRSRVFLDVDIGAEPAGRLIIELFTDKAPKTCENFRQLCTSSETDLTYAKSPFHRVIDEFMIQGGDITSGDGTGGKSIYNDGGEFEDENLDWRDMDAAGLVCMANRGKDTNSSQFFVTLEPCPHLNGKHTIFGQLVAGQDVLAKVAKVRVNDDDVPLDPVLVSRCGELERKRNPATVPTKQSTTERPTMRGRKPSSSEVPVQQDSAHSPGATDQRKRRQSDNHIDENLRGRPRARSDDESDAGTAVDHDRSRSPAPKHKRQRSPSPSRHNDKTGDDRHDDYERRRRRSLPNQYNDDRAQNPGRRDRDRGGQGQGQGQAPRDDRRDATRNDRRHAGSRDWDDPRPTDRNSDRRDDRRDNRGYGGGRRYQDSYRPNRNGQENGAGRLGGGDDRLGGASAGGDGDADGAIKFKGRGSMKYREPDRRW